MQGKKTYQEKLFTRFLLSERVPEQNCVAAMAYNLKKYLKFKQKLTKSGAAALVFLQNEIKALRTLINVYLSHPKFD